MIKNSKPAPDIYLKACEKLGENPTNCIAIEDSKNGILSAKNADMNVIMILICGRAMMIQISSFSPN